MNISPVQFYRGDLLRLVHTILIETGLAPGRLELEITENVMIDDFSRAVSILHRLKAIGVQIAVITSYSIHYTKLYDTGMARGNPSQGDDAAGIIRIERLRCTDAPGPNRLAMTLKRAMYLGERWELLFTRDRNNFV